MIKLYGYMIPKLEEFMAFRTEKECEAYLDYWHLTKSEVDILIESGVYQHDNLGMIYYYSFEPNFFKCQETE